MLNRVILLFFVLVIAIVFPSEAEIPLEEAVANETFLQKIVWDMEQHLENIVDLTINIDNLTSPPSNLEIQAAAFVARQKFAAEITAMPSTIMKERGISIPWKCPWLAAAAMEPTVGMLKRLTIIIDENEMTLLAHNDNLLIIRDGILASVDVHKGNFKACAETCTGSMSCIGSMFCLAWRGLILLFKAPFFLFERHVYSAGLSTQKELLDGFQDYVRSNLEKDLEYMDGKRKILEKVAEVEKCMAG